MTVPDHMRGPWTHGPETVTALAVEGEDRLYELPPTKFIITIGSHNLSDVPFQSAVPVVASESESSATNSTGDK